MKTFIKFDAVTLLLAGWILAWPSGTHAQVPAAAPEKQIVARLAKGGFVIYLRHFQTNPDQADTEPFDLTKVNAQRHLTEEGRQQARALGEAWRKLKLPAGRIVASKFQRAQDSAALLGLGAPTAALDVTEGGLVVTPRENQRRAAALRQLLSTPPASGSNTLIVSHRPNLQDAAGKEFGDLGEGEAAVFEPDGKGGHRFVARIPAATWLAWAK